MSHRREAGAIPPWVIPEEHKRDSMKSGIDQNAKLNVDNEVKEMSYLTHQNDKANVTPNGSMIKSKKEQLYITGGQLVNSDHIQFANILIEDGKIVSTGTNIEVQPDTPTLDATGMLIMPAGIDMSTYLIQDIHSIDTEAYINFTKEALLGGTTTIVDTIICPKDSSAVDLLIKYKNTFKETKFWCDIIIRIGFMEIQENHLNEIEQLTKQHGINSFLFIVDPMEMDKPSKDSSYITNLLKALDKCKQTGSIAVIKCDLRKLNYDCSSDYLNKQNDLEIRSIEKCISLVTSTNCPVIFSSINEMNTVERISEVRRQIPPIHITVCCTSNSLLSEITHSQQFGNGFLPLLTNGDIKLISSDQSNIHTNGKSNSLQTIRQRLITTWKAGVPSGWLDASTFVSLTSFNAAHYLGLYPNKGCLYAGSDADLICWPYDNTNNCTIQHPSLVIHHGKLIVYNGNLIEDISNNNNDLKIIPCNHLNEIQSNQPLGMLQTGKLFPSTIYDLVNAFERLRKTNQIPVIREPWTMNNLSGELTTISKITNNHDNNNNGNNSEQTKDGNPQNLMTTPINIRTIRGNRDLHASGFSLSGAQVDDDRPIRSTIRTQQQSETRNPLW
ncbi:unnamed protein product [Schistosoma intercalatum]|nr:unnamed protein product [Schistosoma intercalatum]